MNDAIDIREMSLYLQHPQQPTAALGHPTHVDRGSGVVTRSVLGLGFGGNKPAGDTCSVLSGGINCCLFIYFFKFGVV